MSDTENSSEEAEEQSQTATQGYATTASQQTAPNGGEQPQTGATTDPIGHVIVLNDLVVTYSGEDSSIKMFVNREARPDIKAGSYVQIPYPANGQNDPELNDELFAMVDAVRYLNENEIDELTQAMGNVHVDGETNERRYDEVAELSPVAIITKDRDGNGEVELANKNVDAVPKPFTWGYKCTEEDYLRTGLNIPFEGLAIGHMAKNGERIPKEDPLVYNVQNPGAGENGESAVFRHSLIAGSTGKGKTFFTKNYLRQLMGGTEYELEDENGNTVSMLPSIIIIDPENEYSEMRHDPEPQTTAQEEWLEKLKQDPNVKVGGLDTDPDFDLQTFVPDVRGSKLQNPPASFSEFSVPFRLVNQNPKLAMPFEAGEPTRNGMRKVLNAFFSYQPIGNAPSYNKGTYDNFMKWLRHFNQLEFKENELAQQYGLNEGVWDALFMRFDQPSYQYVFDSGSAALDSIPSKMFQPGQVSVVPTSHLTPQAERLVVMSLMSLIVENKIGSGDKGSIRHTPLILTVDEAHNFLGDLDSVQGRYIVNKFRQVAKQGRKYKLGLFQITQNPEDIDEELLKQTNSKIYLGLEPEVLSKIPVPEGFRNQIPNFGKGQAVVKAPDVRATEILGYPVCLTRHSK